MPHVVSTLANTQIYADYTKPEAKGQVSRPAVTKNKVVILGGAGVQGALRTPEGVLTKITDADADFLETVELFKFHKKGGYVKIVGREVNADKVAADMKPDSGDTENGARISGGSSQLSVASGDFEPGGRAGAQERDSEQAPLKIL